MAPTGPSWASIGLENVGEPCIRNLTGNQLSGQVGRKSPGKSSGTGDQRGTDNAAYYTFVGTQALLICEPFAQIPPSLQTCI